MAHAEGRLVASDDVIDRLRNESLVALRQVDLAGKATEEYPWNVNGSPYGIAGLSSADGRHLATMVHMERLALGAFDEERKCYEWNHLWPWTAYEDFRKHPASPWLHPFQNAYEWCVSHR